jgi:DNA-binding CsgD family transcriptional regulator
MPDDSRSTMKRSGATAHIRQLCSLGLGSTAVMPALLRSIRRLLPCDSAAYFWADERGEWVNLYAERMLPPALVRRYFERYYEAGRQSFRDRMHECVAHGRSIANIDESDPGSPYFEEILKPLGAYRILHLRLQHAGRPLGQMSLYRGNRWPHFEPEERSSLEALARYLAPGLGASATLPRTIAAGDYRDSDEGALVVCDLKGDVLSASERAYALLAHASGLPINRTTLAGAVEHKGHELLRRLGAALAADAPLHESIPSLLVENTWGRFRLRAFALGDSELGVLIHRQEHMLVRLVDAMCALPLSAQQREVAVLLAGGLTNGEIAQHLGVALNTSSYHVKQLYQKLGAHDRSDAIARILDGPTNRH